MAKNSIFTEFTGDVQEFIREAELGIFQFSFEKDYDDVTINVYDDITILPYNDLGKYASRCRAFCTYLNTLLTDAEVGLRFVETNLKTLVAKAKAEVYAEHGKSCQPGFVSSKVESQDWYIEAANDKLARELTVDSLKNRVKDLEGIITLISREYARRAAENSHGS